MDFKSYLILRLTIIFSDSSVESSSDEHRRTQHESSTTLQNVNSQTNPVTLQRKVSDRKSKRVRAKQNDITGLASSTEILKKSKSSRKPTNSIVCFLSAGSDEDIRVDDDKRVQQQQYQKKKRRPSFKRRKKATCDQAQTDSGIDSRMGRRQITYSYRTALS